MTAARAGIDPQELAKLYASGQNVMAYLRNAQNASQNDAFTILASYDLQAGSYVRALDDPKTAEQQLASSSKFAKIFDDLKPSSLLEVGVGEATTLGNVLIKMLRPPAYALGFDISLSRVLVARAYLASLQREARLFTGTLEAIPLPSNSVDVVYTSHSVEPNGGRERPILTELYRVAKRYVVLREPSNELGSAATQSRMKQHGYVHDLHATALSLGYDVVEHSRWELDSNPLNEAALIVIRKEVAADETEPRLASPISKAPLIECENALYSREDCLVFPMLAGIPCLLADNGVFSVRWLDHVVLR